MPGLIVPILPSAAIDFAKEIREAAKSTLEADPNTQVDGNQGVKTIEIYKPQPDNAFRDYGRKAVPAIALWAQLDSAGWVASNNRQFNYELMVGLVAESGTPTESMDDLEQLREIVLLTLAHNITEQTNTWLTSQNPILHDGSVSADPFEQVERWPHRFQSMSTMPLRVIYRIADIGS